MAGASVLRPSATGRSPQSIAAGHAPSAEERDARAPSYRDSFMAPGGRSAET